MKSRVEWQQATTALDCAPARRTACRRATSSPLPTRPTAIGDRLQTGEIDPTRPVDENVLGRRMQPDQGFIRSRTENFRRRIKFHDSVASFRSYCFRSGYRGEIAATNQLHSMACRSGACSCRSNRLEPNAGGFLSSLRSAASYLSCRSHCRQGRSPLNPSSAPKRAALSNSRFADQPISRS